MLKALAFVLLLAVAPIVGANSFCMNWEKMFPEYEFVDGRPVLEEGREFKHWVMRMSGRTDDNVMCSPFWTEFHRMCDTVVVHYGFYYTHVVDGETVGGVERRRLEINDTVDLIPLTYDPDIYNFGCVQ